MADTYKIFPAIGVARLGNSEDPENYYYIAPETSGGLPILPGNETGIFTQDDFRDSAGNLKRQGARFRVYCFPENGDPYEVLPESGLTIEWTVHLANKKSAWYQFQPVPLSDVEGTYPPTTDYRNPDAPDRAALITDPGPRTVTGENQPPQAFSRDNNPGNYNMTFPPTGLQPEGSDINSLGEIRTDENGRLIVIGGLGHSGTDRLPYPPDDDLNFVNNDRWWDDTADGSVTAKVVLSDGVTKIDAVPAWVVSTPPAYAPEIVAQVTMYDVMYDVAVRYLNYRPEIYDSAAGGYQSDYIVNRKSEIEDLLNRAFPYTWVSTDVGTCHVLDYNNSSTLYARMRSPDDVNELGKPEYMPRLAGDGSISSVPPEEARKYVTFTETQMFFGDQWNNGQFETSDPQPEPEYDRLTRAALDNCSGAAFGPGIEMTWISRRADIYLEAFRLKHRDHDYPLSTTATPLEEGLEPGDFLKFMAIPWQADFNECAIQPINDTNVHWWPAQRMLLVNRDENGTRVENEPWVGSDDSGNSDTYLRFERNTDMVEDWSQLGFAFNVGTAETPDFIEVARTLVPDPAAESKGQSTRAKPKFRSPRK